MKAAAQAANSTSVPSTPTRNERSDVVMAESRSEPDTQAGDELPVEHGAAGRSCEVGGGTEALRELHAHIRCELPTDLVAQPQAELYVSEAAAEPAGRIAAAVEVGFQLRLQDQPLSEAQVVAGAQARRTASGGAQIERGLHVEPVWRQALHAGRQPVARRAVAKVMAHAQRGVPIGRYGVAPQRLDVTVFQPAAAALAFAA